MRALSGLADAARGAMTPADASAIAARIVAAFAPFAREEDGGADVDDDVDDDDDVDAPGFDAWEASVERPSDWSPYDHVGAVHAVP